jgi:hypothetical protein
MISFPQRQLLTVWVSCILKTHTGTAFVNEQLDFHIRVWIEPKICCECSICNEIVGQCQICYSASTLKDLSQDI